MANARDRIEKVISENPVVLFMKGTPEFPQCGFSGQVIQILEYVGAPVVGVNVLEDAEIRQGIKEYANWPTIPQLYIKGEFVGGCDIVRDVPVGGTDVGFDRRGRSGEDHRWSLNAGSPSSGRRRSASARASSKSWARWFDFQGNVRLTCFADNPEARSVERSVDADCTLSRLDIQAGRRSGLSPNP
jgi:monothiol glutaredoxin